MPSFSGLRSSYIVTSAVACYSQSSPVSRVATFGWCNRCEAAFSYIVRVFRISFWFCQCSQTSYFFNANAQNRGISAPVLILKCPRWNLIFGKIIFDHIINEKLVPEKTSKELAYLDSSLHFKHPPYFCSSQRIYLINNRYFSFPSSINIHFMSSTVSHFLLLASSTTTD